MSFEGFTIRQFCVVVVVGPEFRTRGGKKVTAKSQASRPRLSRGESTHRRVSVKADMLWKSVGVWTGLEEPSFFLRGSEACFLGGFIEDVGRRMVSAVLVSNVPFLTTCSYFETACLRKPFRVQADACPQSSSTSTLGDFCES